MFWKISAILILLVFYIIYFSKMFLQRKKGIQTDHIAKSKADTKRYVFELIMKFATYSIAITEVISICLGYSILSIHFKFIGMVTGMLGVIIFGISVFTMRDSWRAGIAEEDKTELITNGIYQISRNPAFLGFDLVYVGILLMYFNIPLTILSVFTITMLHLQILKEEKYLSGVFGKPYSVYRNSVCRYIGNTKHHLKK